MFFFIQYEQKLAGLQFHFSNHIDFDFDFISSTAKFHVTMCLNVVVSFSRKMFVPRIRNAQAQTHTVQLEATKNEKYTFVPIDVEK